MKIFVEYFLFTGAIPDVDDDGHFGLAFDWDFGEGESESGGGFGKGGGGTDEGVEEGSIVVVNI